MSEQHASLPGIETENASTEQANQKPDSLTKILGIIAQVNLLIARTDHAIRTETKPEFSQNPHFRSFSAVVLEGIEQFQQEHPEMPLTFRRLDGFLSFNQFQPLFDEPFTAEQIKRIYYDQEVKAAFLGKTLREAIGVVVKWKLTDTALTSDNLINLIKMLVFAKINRRVVTKVAEASVYINPEIRTRGGSLTQDDLNAPLYNELITLFETAAKKEGQPQSISLAIRYLLEFYQGNLNDTWNMLAQFCKYVTRGEGRAEQAPQWMKLHILDEYSPYFAYQSLPEQESPHRGIFSAVAGVFTGLFTREKHDFWADSSLNNQIGKVYHAAFLLSMLEIVDAKVLAVLTAAEYIAYGTGHGPNKAMADALILQNILKLEQMFTALIDQHLETTPVTQSTSTDQPITVNYPPIKVSA